MTVAQGIAGLISGITVGELIIWVTILILYFKLMSLVILFSLTGCNTLPNFPTFFSHQDLLEQEREIDSSFKKE